MLRLGRLPSGAERSTRIGGRDTLAGMQELREAWALFEDAAVERGVSAFAPLDRAAQEALSTEYVLPAEVRDVLLTRYPSAGVPLFYCDGEPMREPYEGSMITPSVRWLVERRREAPDWPRSWFPIAVTGDHFIQFVRSDAPGVWQLHDDDGVPYEPEAAYTTLAAFVRAAAVSTRHLRPETLRVVESGRWLWKRRHVELVPEIAARVRAESCRAEEGPLLLPQTQIEVFDPEMDPLRARPNP